MMDGSATAIAPVIPPHVPRILYPMWLAMFIAKSPGVACATANMSMNSSFSSHFFLSTISFSMSGTMAYPPPMVKLPILLNVINISFMMPIFLFVVFMVVWFVSVCSSLRCGIV